MVTKLTGNNLKIYDSNALIENEDLKENTDNTEKQTAKTIRKQKFFRFLPLKGLPVFPYMVFAF
ncbi:MAG: hypothetical protein L6V93_09130 [Clostridiales bacterium]|nr:MAG: hypothetical protein L6V93_09130 [Clostridiales bacterium]